MSNVKDCECPHCRKFFSKLGIGIHIWNMHGEGQNKGFRKSGYTPWNKGETKETNNLVKASVEKAKANRDSGFTQHNWLGKTHSEETKRKISKARTAYLEKNPDRVPYLINHSSKQSYPEKILANALTEKGITGWTSSFQNGIYEYDFAWVDIKLDVEVDGSTHNLPKVKIIDERRDAWSTERGWKVLRFSTDRIRKDIDSVCREIENYICSCS